MADRAGGAAVWTYWEDLPGTTRPAYLDLCLETIRRHAAPLALRCVDEDTVVEWLPDVDLERWRGLPAPNYRSDYLRSRVLQRHGGLWIDIDTVALGPLTELVDAVDDTGTLSFGRELGRFFGGLCAAAPGAPFVDAWVEEQDRVLDRRADWSTLPYAGLAQDVTWHVSRRQPWTSFPMDRVAPVPWYQWRRFLSRLESPARVLAGSPVTVVLWNAVMAPYLRRYDADALLRSRMLTARLLRIGLGTAAPTEEEDLLTRLAPLERARFTKPVQATELAVRRALGQRS